MLAAQVICTNAFYKQVQQERNIDNSFNGIDDHQTIEILKKMINAINIEIEEIKKQL